MFPSYFVVGLQVRFILRMIILMKPEAFFCEKQKTQKTQREKKGGIGKPYEVDGVCKKKVFAHGETAQSVQDVCVSVCVGE